MNGSFHLAFATRNLDKAKDFYGGVLGCKEGRSGSTWIDYNFFGHQLTIQYVSSKHDIAPNFFHPRTMFPANHFGIILKQEDWRALVRSLTEKSVGYVIEPQTVFENEVGEQLTLMIKDDDGHIIEFKSFESEDKIFKK